MGNQALKEEKYIDIEELLRESLSDTNVTEEQEDLVLEYLCQTISKTDSYDALKRRAANGDAYAYIQLASWHIAHAKNIKDYCDAFQYASKAVKHGYIEAYYILGQLYLYGTGCTKNVHKAIKYLSYFVNKVSRKELLNDSVLIDAYLKLADAEKSLGHYEKSYHYYQMLQEISPQYSSDIQEIQEQLQNRQNERASYFIYLVIGCMILCAVIYSLTVYLTAQTQEYANKYPQQTDKIMITKPTTVVQHEEPEPAPKIQIQEPVSYTLVSEGTFQALMLSEIPVTKVISSSEYISTKGNNYSAANLIDHDSSTTWQEGEEDSGIDQTITFYFAEPTIISAIRLENGKQTSKDAFYENNRVASFSLFGDEPLLVELPDEMAVQYIVFENPILDDKVQITLKSTFGGTNWNDTCLTEVTFYE